MGWTSWECGRWAGEGRKLTPGSLNTSEDIGPPLDHEGRATLLKVPFEGVIPVAGREARRRQDH